MQIAVVEASLELIPEELWKCREVLRYSRKRGKNPKKLLLDASEVKGCIEKLEDAQRRGRPDLVHRVLLTALDSPLNSLGHLEKLFLHTITGRWFEIRPEARLPRNYNRFVGLMEQLLVKGRVPLTGPWLIKELKTAPRFKEPVVVLDPEGREAGPEFFEGFDGTLVLGGFPHGTYRHDWRGVKVSVAREVLTASAALCIALSWIYGGIRKSKHQ